MVFPQSTYSLSLRMAHEVGYWDPDVIPEDWHMFLKCFFTFSGSVEVESIFLPTGNDAVRAATTWRSYVEAYQQHKRHAWGVRYPLCHTGTAGARRNVLASPRASGGRPQLEPPHVVHALVPAQHRLVGALGDQQAHRHGDRRAWAAHRGAGGADAVPVPVHHHDPGGRTVAPAQAGVVATADDAVALAMWVLLPITSFLFSTAPALVAQTRLMVGRRLEYRVTEKV
ncbi:MAG: glycosyltransferase family 2 protein [Dehalococcoidia bacterium]